MSRTLTASAYRWLLSGHGGQEDERGDRKDRSAEPNRRGGTSLGDLVSRGDLRTRPPQRVRIVVGHHPVGAVHRRPREHGDARAVRSLPGPVVVGRRRRGRTGSDHSLHRLLREQGQESDRHGDGTGGTFRRRGAERFGRSRHASGGRAQNRQRGAQRGVRSAGIARGHARGAALAATRIDQARGPGEGRVATERLSAGFGVGAIQSATDPAWASRVRRAQTEV